MPDKLEKRKRFIINTAFFTVVAIIIYAILKYALSVLLPFFVAFVISSLLQPAVRFLRKKTKLKEKKASAAVVILFLCTVGVFISLLTIEIFVLVRGLLHSAPLYYTDTIQPAFVNLLQHVETFMKNFDSDFALDYSALTPQFSSLIPSLNSIFSFTTNILSTVPGFLISVLISVISLFFISGDYTGICRFCLYQLPEKTRHTIIEIRDYTKEILFKYVRSYVLILTITFMELSILLLTAGLINPDMFPTVTQTILTALVIALFDLLPIVGTGSILVPWGIIRILLGDILTGVMLVSIFLIVTVVRNIIEPKIVGTQVGLHPIVTLMAMIVGTASFGVVGLFLFPITLALLKDLNDRGKIHLFKPVPKE